MEKMPLITALAVAPVSIIRIMLMPFARSARSPAVNLRKNVAGNESSRLQTAVWRFSSIRPSMRSSERASTTSNIMVPNAARSSAAR